MHTAQRNPFLVLVVVALLATACQPIQPPTPIPADQPVTSVPTEKHATEFTADQAAADRLLQEGIQYHNDGDDDRAVIAFTKAIRLNPDLAGAYVNRAAAYLRLGDLEAAISDCNEAVRLNSEDADAHMYRGIAYAYLGDFDPAIQDLTEAIRLDPSSVNAHTYRGASYYLVERYAAAVQDCVDAIRLSGGYFLPAEICLSVIGKLGSPDFENSEAAIQDFSAAIEANPEAAAAYLFRGFAYRTLGDIEPAVRDIQEGLRLDPLLSDIAIMLWAFAYSEPADPAAAIRQLEIALEIVEPDSLLANLVEGSLADLRAGD